jgi:hypothetical protein
VQLRRQPSTHPSKTAVNGQVESRGCPTNRGGRCARPVNDLSSRPRPTLQASASKSAMSAQILIETGTTALQRYGLMPHVLACAGQAGPGRTPAATPASSSTTSIDGYPRQPDRSAPTQTAYICPVGTLSTVSNSTRTGITCGPAACAWRRRTARRTAPCIGDVRESPRLTRVVRRPGFEVMAVVESKRRKAWGSGPCCSRLHW